MVIFLGDLLEKPEDLFDFEPHTRVEVPVVPDVPVSPSSVVTEVCGVCSCCSDWEFVEPQSFPFSKKRVWTATQEEMMYEDSPVKALPPSRRRMTPPAPLKNSYSSFEGEQGYCEVENQNWRAREKAPWRRLLHRMKDSGKWAWKSSVVLGGIRCVVLLRHLFAISMSNDCSSLARSGPSCSAPKGLRRARECGDRRHRRDSAPERR